MARQVEDITVKLGIEGFEELNKLRSSFRELTKVTNATDTQLDNARKRLLELKTELGNTARVNKGLTDAFGALLDEAKRGSDVWKQLNADLSKLRQESRLTDTQVGALRDIIISEAKAHAQSANSIRDHVKSLQDLRNQATLNGKVHQELSVDIARLTAKLQEGEVANKKHYSSLGQILAVKPDAVLRQWEAYTRILQESTASADKLATAQRRLNQLSGAPRILERRRVSQSAAITQDPEYLRRFGFEGASLPELPNTNAAYAQQIKELQQDLAHLDRSSIEYLQTLMTLTGVQRQSTEVARGYAQALLMGVQTKTVANSTRNLQEVITALRAEMQQLDTTTSEGSAAYAQNANQVRNLEQQLKALAGAYRHVGDMATEAATAEQNAANARIRNNYLNRGLVRQQEAALAELGQRVREGVSTTPPLLPAAGQTSAPGAGLNISGGANVRAGAMATAGGQRQSVTDVGGNIPVMGVRPGSGVQRFFGSADVGAAALYPGAVPIGPSMTPRQGGENRTRMLTEAAQAYNALGASAERARRPLRDIFADITTVTSASNNSLTSLRRQAELWGELRAAVNPAAPAYKKAGEELDRLNGRIERLDRSRRKLSGMQLAQGVGAALSGGIFGGPEGLVGGLVGLAGGGVGGAFAGAAFGAQVGMFRQQLAGITEYSAGIDKLQIALRGIVGSQEAYSQAIAAAAAVTRDLNIPQETAIQGMTRLSAAVLGAGGKVSDSAFAFRAISEAVKATGGNAEQADGALLALTQVFSKGKVSAEELNQIAERIPGTFTLFAKAAGKSGPELQKALQQGQVGLNDLMKFLQLISSEYGQTALKIAASSQEAGARLSVAFKNMQLEVGRALQPIGASLQSAFADFITKITPDLVAALKGIAAAFEFLIENKTASNLATLALRLGAVAASLVILRTAVSSIAALKAAELFAGTAASIKITGDAAAASALSVRGLAAAFAAVPGLGWIAAGATAIGLLSLALYENNYTFKTWVDNIKTLIMNDFVEAWNRAIKTVEVAVQTIDTLLRGLAGIGTLIGSAITAQLDTIFGGAFQRIAEFWNRLPAPIRKAMEDNAARTASGVLSMGNPIVAYALKTGITATTMGPPGAQDTGMFGRYGAPGTQKPQPPGALTNFLTAQDEQERKDKAARDDQAAAAEQQRLASTLLDQRLRADDRVFQHQIELDRQRYELQKRLDDTQAQNRILRETGAARDFVSNFEDLQRSLREIEERRVAAAENVSVAKQAQKSADIRAAFEGQGAAALSSGATGFIPKEQLREWLIKQGFGRTTGDFTDRGHSAPRHTLNAMDMGILGGSDANALRLTAAMERRLAATGAFGGQLYGPLRDPAGHGAGRGGQNIHLHIPTPGGRVPLTPGLASLMGLGTGARLPTGAAAQQNRAIQTAGKAGTESLDVNQALSAQKLIEDNAPKERAALFEQYTLKAADALREQNATMRDNNALQVLRNRLTLEGVSPEHISLEEDLLRISLKQNETYLAYLELVAQHPAKEGKLTDALAAQNEQYAEQARLLRENAAASDNAIANRIGQLRQQRNELTDVKQVVVSMSQTVESSLSTAISSAVTNLVTGAQTIKQTLAEMFSSIAKAFIDMAAQIIAKQLVIIALNAVAKIFGGSTSGGGNPLSGATPLESTNWGGGSIFGDLGGGMDWGQTPGIAGFASGGIMTSAGPLPLKRYAAGGVASSPQMAVFGERGPEAYVPLPDGRSIPVRMRQRTEALNRYKPISATGTVSAAGDLMAGGAGAATAGGPIDVRYSVERINNVEYVTAEQFRDGMQQAAAQGAQRGEQRALRSLQQSTSVRSKVGLR